LIAIKSVVDKWIIFQEMISVDSDQESLYFKESDLGYSEKDELDNKYKHSYVV